MIDNRTAIAMKHLQETLRYALKQMLEREADNVDFQNYCEGIIRSCIAALGCITGEYK